MSVLYACVWCGTPLTLRGADWSDIDLAWRDGRFSELCWTAPYGWSGAQFCNGTHAPIPVDAEMVA